MQMGQSSPAEGKACLDMGQDWFPRAEVLQDLRYSSVLP